MGPPHTARRTCGLQHEPAAGLHRLRTCDAGVVALGGGCACVRVQASPHSSHRVQQGVKGVPNERCWG
jgi:hypothetical protein